MSGLVPTRGLLQDTPGTLLGPCGTLLAPSWDPPVPSEALLNNKMALFSYFWGHPGPLRGPFGALRGAVDGSLGRLGSTQYGFPSPRREAGGACRGPRWRPAGPVQAGVRNSGCKRNCNYPHPENCRMSQAKSLFLNARGLVGEARMDLQCLRTRVLGL